VIAGVGTERSTDGVNRFQQDRKWVLPNKHRDLRRRAVFSVVLVQAVKPVWWMIKVVIGPDETVMTSRLHPDSDCVCFSGASDRIAGGYQADLLW
jgi:hypothetical protein